MYLFGPILVIFLISLVPTILARFILPKGMPVEDKKRYTLWMKKIWGILVFGFLIWLISYGMWTHKNPNLDLSTAITANTTQQNTPQDQQQDTDPLIDPRVIKNANSYGYTHDPSDNIDIGVYYALADFVLASQQNDHERMQKDFDLANTAMNTEHNGGRDYTLISLAQGALDDTGENGSLEIQDLNQQLMLG